MVAGSGGSTYRDRIRGSGDGEARFADESSAAYSLGQTMKGFFA